MSKFPVVRDLMVDRSPHVPGARKDQRLDSGRRLLRQGPGPRQSPEEQQQAYPLSECMSCGCCLEACPQYLKIEAAPARRRNATRQFAARKQAAYDRGFIGAARHQPGDAVQHASHRQDERRRAARRPDGRRRHPGLRQRPELRDGLPQKHSAHSLDRPRRPGTHRLRESKSCSIFRFSGSCHATFAVQHWCCRPQVSNKWHGICSNTERFRFHLRNLFSFNQEFSPWQKRNDVAR